MDIIERLRNDDPVYGVRPSLAMEAADEIERLRNALYDIQDMPEGWESDEELNLLFVIDTQVRIAKDVLGITEDK